MRREIYSYSAADYDPIPAVDEVGVQVEYSTSPYLKVARFSTFKIRGIFILFERFG